MLYCVMLNIKLEILQNAPDAFITINMYLWITTVVVGSIKV